MITTATPEQWAQIDQIRQNCIDQQTEPISSEDCRKAVEDMWASLGKAKPRVIQVDGPFAMLSAFYSLHLPAADGLDGLNKALFDSVEGLDQEKLEQIEKSKEPLLNKMYMDLLAQLSHQLSRSLWDQLRDAVDQTGLGDNSSVSKELFNIGARNLQGAITTQLGQNEYDKLSDAIFNGLSQRTDQLHSALKEYLKQVLDKSLRLDVSSQISINLESQNHEKVQQQLSEPLLDALSDKTLATDAVSLLPESFDGAVREELKKRLDAIAGEASFPSLNNSLDNQLTKPVNSLTGSAHEQLSQNLRSALCAAIFNILAPQVLELGRNVSGQLSKYLTEHRKEGSHIVSQLSPPLVYDSIQKLDDPLTTSLEAQLNTQLENNFLMNQVYEQVASPLITESIQKLFTPLRDSIYLQLSDQLREAVERELRTAMQEKLTSGFRADLSGASFKQLDDESYRQLMVKALDPSLFTTDLDNAITEEVNSQIGKSTGEKLKSAVEKQLMAELSDKLGGELRPNITRDLGDQLSSEFKHSLSETLKRPLMGSNDQVSFVVLAAVESQLLELTAEQMKEKLNTAVEQNVRNALVNHFHNSVSDLHTESITQQLGGPIYAGLIKKLREKLVDLLRQQQGGISEAISRQTGEAAVDQLKEKLNTAVDQHAQSALVRRLHNLVRTTLSESFSSQVSGDLYVELAEKLRDRLVKLLEQSSEQLSQPMNAELNKILESFKDGNLTAQLENRLMEQVTVAISKALEKLDHALEQQAYAQLIEDLAHKLSFEPHFEAFSIQLDSQLTNIITEINEKFRKALYSSVWWRAWSGWYDGAVVLGVKFNQENLDLFQRWCRFCPLVFPGESTVIVCRNPVSISWKEGLLHNESGPSVEFADGFKVYTIDGIAVDEQIVMAPETQTIEQIEQEENADRKAIRIARYGWPRYLKDIKAEKLDDRSNELEGTKEALFSLPDGETKLVVTCPTGRVFTMGVGDGPNQIKTCDEAQKWIHRGRTMLSRT